MPTLSWQIRSGESILSIQFMDTLFFSNLSMTTDLAESVSNCDLMVEAVIEDLKLKQKLFVQMENNAPAHAILSTNTSSLPITEICVDMKDKSRFGGLHFFNPVPVMK